MNKRIVPVEETQLLLHITEKTNNGRGTMDGYYNGLTYESLPSEDRTVKYVYLGQPSHECIFIDESVDLQYMLNNEAYLDEQNN